MPRSYANALADLAASAAAGPPGARRDQAAAYVTLLQGKGGWPGGAAPQVNEIDAAGQVEPKAH